MARQAAEKENPTTLEDDVLEQEDLDPEIAASTEDASEDIALASEDISPAPVESDVGEATPEIVPAPRRMTFQIEGTA
jgi:hypothetical protein